MKDDLKTMAALLQSLDGLQLAAEVTTVLGIVFLAFTFMFITLAFCG